MIDKSVASLPANVFRASLRNDLSFLDVEGQNVSRVLTADIPELRTLLWNNVSFDRGLRCAVQIAAGCILALSVDPMLSALIFVFLMPTLSITAGSLVLQKQAADNLFVSAEGDVRFEVTEALDSIRTVKAYGVERIESKSFVTEQNNALARSEDVARARAQSECMLKITIYVTLIAVYSCGGYCVGVGLLSTRKFLSLTSFCWILLFSLIGLSTNFSARIYVEGILPTSIDS